MILTKSSNPNSMVLASAKVEITKEAPIISMVNGKKDYSFTGLQDMGLARAVSIVFASTAIEVKADNGTVPIKGKMDNKATVTFNILERHLPLLADAMAGLASLEIVPGEEQTVVDKHGGGLTVGKLYVLSKFNADGTEPRDITLTQGSSSTLVTLVLGTDYEVIEAAKTFYFRLVDGGSYDSAKALTVTYKATGAQSYILKKGSGGVSKPLCLRITNKRKTDDGRTISRVIELPHCFFNAEDTLTFKSKNDADNVMEVPMSFEGSPHPDMAEDADLEAMSLCREIQQV